MRILHRAGGVVALDKPSGCRSHPGRGQRDPGALLTVPFRVKDEAFCWREASGRERTLYLLHRLDAPTSGVILLAEEGDVAAEAKRCFSAHAVEKVYFALVRGTPSKLPATWRDRLRTGQQGKGRRTVSGSGAPAECRVEVASRSRAHGGLTLLRLHPKTGRTHQLRVQCADRHLPIVGDATYGDFAFNRRFAREEGEKRLFLHASSIELRVGGTRFRAESPLPGVFRRFTEEIGGGG